MEVKLTFHAHLQMDSLPEDDRAIVDEGIDEIQADPTIGVKMPELGPVRRLHDTPDYVIMYDVEDLITVVAVTEIPLIDDLLFG